MQRAGEREEEEKPMEAGGPHSLVSLCSVALSVEESERDEKWWTGGDDEEWKWKTTHIPQSPSGRV